MEKNKNKYIAEEIKVILVGESGTGKTSLINATMGLKFQEHLESTATNNLPLLPTFFSNSTPEREGYDMKTLFSRFFSCAFHNTSWISSQDIQLGFSMI